MQLKQCTQSKMKSICVALTSELLFCGAWNYSQSNLQNLPTQKQVRRFTKFATFIFHSCVPNLEQVGTNHSLSIRSGAGRSASSGLGNSWRLCVCGGGSLSGEEGVRTEEGVWRWCHSIKSSHWSSHFLQGSCIPEVKRSEFKSNNTLKNSKIFQGINFCDWKLFVRFQQNSRLYLEIGNHKPWTGWLIYSIF